MTFGGSAATEGMRLASAASTERRDGNDRDDRRPAPPSGQRFVAARLGLHTHFSRLTSELGFGFWELIFCLPVPFCVETALPGRDRSGYLEKSERQV